MLVSLARRCILSLILVSLVFDISFTNPARMSRSRSRYSRIRTTSLMIVGGEFAARQQVTLDFTDTD